MGIGVILEELTSSSGWGICPLDVLVLIFQNLDGESLVNCLGVNQWWRDVVDYYGQHYCRWRDIAEAGMTNRGLKFRNKSSSHTTWRDLFFNSHLWNHVGSAIVSWGYFRTEKDIQTLHVYKDILFIGHGERETSLGGDMYKELEMLQHKIYDIKTKSKSSDNNSNDKYEDPIAEAVREDTTKIYLEEDLDNPDRIKEKLLKECPFTRYSIFDDNCFYILDEKNVLRRYVWNNTEKKWADEVLGRYFGCSGSIKDIHVADNDVYILTNASLVMRADREGRNFEKASFINFPPQSLMFFMRLIRSPVLRTLETACELKMSPYKTGPNMLFHKFSAVVGVPSGHKFKIRRQADVDQVVLECPDLSCALEHGEILFLGYMDGRVDICKAKDLIEYGYRPKLSLNVLDCRNCLDLIDDPAIVGIEVFEGMESHHLFIATRFNVYSVSLTYPEDVKDSISVLRRIS